MLGATGTIGQATVRALLAQRHSVVCLVRSQTVARALLPAGAQLRQADVCSAQSLTEEGLRGEHFDVLVSCLASRNGKPKDAWAIDHAAHVQALAAARAAGVQQVVLLSAICVQKPTLAFQQAKLAFEAALVESGLVYSIVRPTAFFKSLSGQVARVQGGKPFLIFGDGQLTACKPISDADLGRFIADCLHDSTRHNRILPIGGPGPAITPLQQGQMLFDLLGLPPRYKRVPLRLMDAIVVGLSLLGRLVPPLAAKAELARIGRYYATESMLVLNSDTGLYDAQATPSTGRDTLREHYARMLRGEATVERGEHAIF